MRVFAGLLACFTLLFVMAIWPALSGPFVFDDFPNLIVLDKVRALDGWRMLGIFLSEARSFPGRPLSMLSFLAQAGAWPSNPFPFKVANLALHLANSGLVATLAYRLSAPRLADQRQAWLLAMTVAVAWMVHPMQLSALLLVVQRMTLLSSFFILAGLLCYVHGLTRETLSPARRASWMMGGIAIGTALSVLSKETGILLPLYAWIIDATLFRDQRDALPRGLKILRRLLLFPALLGLAAFLCYPLLDPFSSLPTRGFSTYERLLTESRILLDYAVRLLVPRYDSYSVYHDDYLPSHGLLTPWPTLPCVLLVASAFVAGIASARRRPLLAFGILWFLGGHVLESGPISLELYFEHRNYLPFLGPLLAGAIALTRLPDSPHRKLGIAIASLWLAFSLFNSALYAQVWSDPNRLAYFWAQSHPESIRAQSDYADSLFQNGQAAKARQVIARIAARRPGDAGSAVQLFYFDCLSKTATSADADALRNRLALSQWSRLAYQSLGNLRQLASRQACPSALDRDRWLGMSDALLGNSAFEHDPIALGNLHYQRHELAVSDGNLNAALAELDQTARYEKDPEIARLKAQYLVDAGLPADAISVLKSYDPAERPLLRRLLVNDVAINKEMIAQIVRGMAAPPPPPSR